MTIGEALMLEFRFVERLDREILLAHVLRKTKEYLMAFPEIQMQVFDQSLYMGLLDRRRYGEPIAYLVNRKEFYGLDFFVDDRVLIPRPDTELIVEEVMEKLKEHGRLKVLELGTGSGAISVSLANFDSSLEIMATDVSEYALQVSEINAKKHRVDSQIRFLQSDLLEDLNEKDFNLIVANLPYIGTEENRFVEKNVEKHEPNLALFAGKDGLDLYRKLFKQIKDYKFKPKHILGEIGFNQSEILKEEMDNFFDQYELSFRKDLSGYNRVFVLNF